MNPSTPDNMEVVEVKPFDVQDAGDENVPTEIYDDREPSTYFWLAVLALSILLGLEAVRVHWVPNKWLHGDGSFYANVSRGILENFSLRQESMHPHSWYERDMGWNQNIDAGWSNVALGRNGEWWPKHPILMPICAVPFLFVFGPIGTLIFHFIFYALISVMAFRVASRVASRPAALAAACAMAVMPWVCERAWGFNNDVFYTVLILATLDSALAGKPRLTGALLGISVFAKATNVLYGPAILGIFLMRKDFRGALKMSLWAAGPAAAYLGLNWFMFGSPFHTGYDRILVREAGILKTHSHSTDFHFSELGPALGRVLFGGEGFLGKFPLFFPALAGLVVLAARQRWREAAVLGWCIVLPIVFHAPYSWYRLEFNLPQVALSVAPLAALIPPWGPPSGEEPYFSSVRWARLGVAATVAFALVFGGGRLLSGLSRGYFWKHIPEAEVYLGDIPCDYYNNQMERWECSHFDSDWFMTGRPLTPDLRFQGRVEKVLLFHPHPTGKERRIEYSDVPMKKKLELRYGLADNSRCGAQVNFKVQIDGKTVLREDVSERRLQVKEIDTLAFAGRNSKVILSVVAPNADGCVFGVDGSPLD